MCPGLSPDLNDFDQIRSIARPTDVPDTGLLCDLLWSDPDKDMQGWGENDRGVSFTFGSDIVTKFLNRHDLDLICRAHQVCLVMRGALKNPCAVHTLHCSGSGRWIWVLFSTSAGYIILSAQLLWWLWQCWWYDDCGRGTHVLISGTCMIYEKNVNSHHKFWFSVPVIQ